ncbi:hypothetical protein ACFRFH_10630 [Leifsonia sp. NPDC056824]|uniref:hypothetical protein n=1 Tax=Leifsonia sp. NPDC056824 TaxID=3345953 RepID=UPI0036B41FBF
MKIFKQRDGQLAKRRKQAGVAIAVSIASVVVSLVGAAPAQAAAKGFTIYYSPNCAGASRYYPGMNSGEEWINDRFNSSPIHQGYGQGIRQNAASISIPYGTTVSIAFYRYENGHNWRYASFAGGGFCVNFDSFQRNGNMSWRTS